MILFLIQTMLWNDCLYDNCCPRLHEVRFCPLRSESSAVCAPRLQSQEVVLRLTSGLARVQRHAAPQSVMFSILSMWKANHFCKTLTLSSISCNLRNTNQTTHLSCFPLGDIYDDRVSSIYNLITAKRKIQNKLPQKRYPQKTRDKTMRCCSQCRLKTAWYWC